MIYAILSKLASSNDESHNIQEELRLKEQSLKIVIQRSGVSKVDVGTQTVGAIKYGMVLLVCCEKGDSEATIEKACDKILKLRIFEDEDGKMNRDITQANGEVLAISQFTLSWNGQKGNRPSFDNSMPPVEAEKYFNKLCESLARSVHVEKGKFGASMSVSITNLGPVTFSLSFL